MAHPVSDHFNVDMCSNCTHLHFTFFDADDNVLCEAVISPEQLRKAADWGEANDATVRH